MAANPITPLVSRIQALQDEIDRLENLVGDYNEALSYLSECKFEREKTYAYTQQQTEEQKFCATVNVNGLSLDILIKETPLKHILENNEILDKLHSAKARMQNIENFLN